MRSLPQLIIYCIAVYFHGINILWINPKKVSTISRVDYLLLTKTIKLIRHKNNPLYGLGYIGSTCAKMVSSV